MLRDHPVIERMERTGYPEPQLESCGTDFFDCEILEGDDVVIFEGEMALRENLENPKNLENFLAHFGFEFKTAM